MEKSSNVSSVVYWLACLSISVSRNLSFIVYALPVHMLGQVVPKMAILHERCALFGSLEGSHFGRDFGTVLEPFWIRFWSHFGSHFGDSLEAIYAVPLRQVNRNERSRLIGFRFVVEKAVSEIQ